MTVPRNVNRCTPCLEGAHTRCTGSAGNVGCGCIHAAPVPVPLCPQAWHAGLPTGLLRECKYAAGHRGWHRDEHGHLAWGGKLTEGEMLKAESLRWEARQ